MISILTERESLLLVKKKHNRSDNSAERCGANDGVIAFKGLLNDGWICSPVEVNHSVSGYSGGRSSIALGKIGWSNLDSSFQPQSSRVYGLNLVQPRGSSSLPWSWSSGSPSANSLLASVNHECESSINPLDALPTERIGLNRIDNGQALVEKDDFRTNIGSAGQDSKENAPEGYINGVVSTACIPGTDIDTQKEEKQKSEHQIAFSSTENRGISSIALTHHAVIVSQKVEK